MKHSNLELAITQEKMAEKVWLMTAEAAKQLNVTARYLSDLRRNGGLKSGIHYRVISKPGAVRPTYQYHWRRCAQLWEQHRQ